MGARVRVVSAVDILMGMVLTVMVCGRRQRLQPDESVGVADRARLCGHVKLSLLNSADHSKYHHLTLSPPLRRRAHPPGSEPSDRSERRPAVVRTRLNPERNSAPRPDRLPELHDPRARQPHRQLGASPRRPPADRRRVHLHQRRAVPRAPLARARPVDAAGEVRPAPGRRHVRVSSQYVAAGLLPRLPGRSR